MKSFFLKLIDAIWVFSPMIVLFFACSAYMYMPDEKDLGKMKQQQEIKSCSSKLITIGSELWTENHF